MGTKNKDEKLRFLTKDFHSEVRWPQALWHRLCFMLLSCFSEPDFYKIRWWYLSHLVGLRIGGKQSIHTVPRSAVIRMLTV